MVFIRALHGRLGDRLGDRRPGLGLAEPKRVFSRNGVLVVSLYLAELRFDPHVVGFAVLVSLVDDVVQARGGAISEVNVGGRSASLLLNVGLANVPLRLLDLICNPRNQLLFVNLGPEIRRVHALLFLHCFCACLA